MGLEHELWGARLTLRSWLVAVQLIPAPATWWHWTTRGFPPPPHLVREGTSATASDWVAPMGPWRAWPHRAMSLSLLKDWVSAVKRLPLPPLTSASIRELLAHFGWSSNEWKGSLMITTSWEKQSLSLFSLARGCFLPRVPLDLICLFHGPSQPANLWLSLTRSPTILSAPREGPWASTQRLSEQTKLLITQFIRPWLQRGSAYIAWSHSSFPDTQSPSRGWESAPTGLPGTTCVAIGFLDKDRQ